MKIVVIDVAAESGGALTILRSFYDYAVKNGGAHSWVFLLSGGYIAPAPNIEVHTMPDIKKNWLARIRWELFEAGRLVRLLHPDAVFSLQNLTVFGLRGIPQYIYMHQVLPFQTEKRFSPFRRSERVFALYQRLYRPLISRSVRASRGVFVQGDFTRRILVSRHRHDAAKIYLAPPPLAGLPVKKAEYAPESSVGCRRFLYPASGAVYKNHACITEAVWMLAGRGYRDFRVVFTLPREAAVRSLPQIEYAGHIEPGRLYEMYADSVLVFPSYIESYGMPLAEAMQAGAVIFAAGCDYARELLAGYPNAYFFDPFRPAGLASLMAELLDGRITYHAVGPRPQPNGWETVLRVITGGKGGPGQ